MKHGPSSHSFAQSTTAGRASSNQTTAHVPDKISIGGQGHPGAPDSSKPGRGTAKSMGGKPRMNQASNFGAGAAS